MATSRGVCQHETRLTIYSYHLVQLKRAAEPPVQVSLKRRRTSQPHCHNLVSMYV